MVALWVSLFMTRAEMSLFAIECHVYVPTLMYG